ERVDGYRPRRPFVRKRVVVREAPAEDAAIAKPRTRRVLPYGDVHRASDRVAGEVPDRAGVRKIGAGAAADGSAAAPAGYAPALPPAFSAPAPHQRTRKVVAAAYPPRPAVESGNDGVGRAVAPSTAIAAHTRLAVLAVAPARDLSVRAEHAGVELARTHLDGG